MSDKPRTYDVGLREPLLPCPFCGSKPTWTSMDRSRSIEIRCTGLDCLACMRFGGELQAIEAWNSRPELAGVTRERDALKLELDLIAQHDGSCFAPAHRALVKKARTTLARLASGELRDPAPLPIP